MPYSTQSIGPNSVCLSNVSLSKQVFQRSPITKIVGQDTVYIGFYDQTPLQVSGSLNPKMVTKLSGFLLGLTTRWSIKPEQTILRGVQQPLKVLTVAISLHK